MAVWGARTLGQQPPRVVAIRPQASSGGTAAHSVTRVATSPSQTPAWTPPPIPAGAYNPIRDIELNAGKRGLGNTLEDLGTANTRGEASYLLNDEGITRQEGQQAEDHTKALAQIADSFRRLGVRQTEQARGAGVLRGGALLQSAAKRAANQTKANEPVDQTFSRQTTADQLAHASLALQRQQAAEDNAMGASRAQREQSQFGLDTQTLEQREAAENGYLSPTAPPPAPGRVSVQPGAGFVRVGGPLKRQRR